MLTTACVAMIEPGDAELDAADVVEVDEHERDHHPVPEGVDEPAHLQREDRARKRREVHAEKSAHRGTLATDARGFPPRSGRRLLQPRRLRRVSGRGVRRSTSGGSASSSAEPTEFLARRFDGRDVRGAWRPRRVRRRARPTTSCSRRMRPSALNAVIRSLRIRPEEEILTTKHEYGAILRTLGFIRANVVLVEPDELVSNIGIRTRAIVVSHITSPTGARPAGRGDLRRGTAGRRPLHRRRRTRAGPHSARPRSARRGRVRGQLPQVAVRAQGLGLPVGAAASTRTGSSPS